MGGIGRESLPRREVIERSSKLTFSSAWSVGEAGRLEGDFGVGVGFGSSGMTMRGAGVNVGGVSTSIGSGLGGAAAGVGVEVVAEEAALLRPVKSGFSREESLSGSTTTPAVPIVGLTTLLRLRVGRGGPLLAGAAGGGMKVCGLKVFAHSSCENFVPPGDCAIGISESE